jgi:hypothetical protein
MAWQTVSPAYGRDYKSAKEAMKDWKDGKDFRCRPQGVYTSIRDWKLDDVIEIRYNKLMDVAIYEIGRD